MVKEIAPTGQLLLIETEILTELPTHPDALPTTTDGTGWAVMEPLV